jgi:RNA-binding protein Musashi
MQFGRVIDATLMMDKDTGRPRGFGFVTFDGDEAVDRALSRPLEIYGKPMEVKRAQPRSTLQQQNEEKKFGRGNERFAGNQNQGFDQQQQQQAMGASGMAGPQAGLSPAMMAKYWYNMQQYFRQMQTMMAQNMQPPMGMPNAMAGGQMNPAMMANMMAMAGNASPNAQAMQQAGGQQSGMMSPSSMAQQMAAVQQQQSTSQQQQAPQGGSPDNSAQQQQSDYPRDPRNNQNYNQQSYAQGGPTSWDGMYDDVPAPPAGPAQRGYGRGGFARGGGGATRMGSGTPPSGPAAIPPPNAPTGPKNAGRPGANYRGGGHRGGGHRGYHPYAR